MRIGEMNTLRVLRFTSVGAYLGDDEDNDVLLPTKYLSENVNLNDDIDVYLYRDSEDRLIATTGYPTIHLNGFAFLRVKEVTFYGAFVDWGMEKDLLVPFKEQHIQLIENQYYLTSLRLDELTNRLYGTTKVKKLFEPCEDFNLEGQEVSLLIGDNTDLGTKVIVEDKYQGLVYQNDVTRPIKRGDYTTGFVTLVREDGKLDIRLERSGYDKIDDLSQRLLDVLKDKKVLRLSDKSDPEIIRSMVGMSKKAFKQSVGKLYKQRLIEISEDHISLI